MRKLSVVQIQLPPLSIANLSAYVTLIDRLVLTLNVRVRLGMSECYTNE